MARPPRDQDAGTFHVTCHSVWSTKLFFEHLDFQIFGVMLTRMIVRHGWTCLAAVLMPNHYHLLVDVEARTLPVGMQALNYGYARDFNRRYRLNGHVFGARFSAPRVDSEGYLLAAYRYVVRNPVRAGLCKSPADWPWSSYSGSVGSSKPFLDVVDASRVLTCFGQPRRLAIERLRAFVERE